MRSYSREHTLRRTNWNEPISNRTDLNAAHRAGAGGGTLSEESAASIPLHQRIVQHRCERLAREGKIIAEVRSVLVRSALTAHEAVKASQDSNEARGSVPVVPEPAAAPLRNNLKSSAVAAVPPKQQLKEDRAVTQQLNDAQAEIRSLRAQLAVSCPTAAV